MIVALAGGVGGAKLASGLARVLPPRELTVVVNTADDFVHLGLHISPDLDTVMYNLAGRHNPDTGWGLADETWNFMHALRELGGENWFLLGDRDLAVHVERTRRLSAGESLTDIARAFGAALGIKQDVVPMSNEPVRTVVHTDRGELAFQDYFVRLRCEPAARAIAFHGIETALPSQAMMAALADPALEALIICPSNPFLSVAPIIALAGVRDSVRELEVPVVAVSPIVGGRAVKGPAAKLLQELGHEISALAIAKHYREFADLIVIDECDAMLQTEIRALGMDCLVSQTLMRTDADKDRLARVILEKIASGR